MGHAILSAALAASVLAAPAHADQVRFTGQTTADDLLVRDTVQYILKFGYAAWNCPTLEAVEAVILPSSYKPTGAATRPEAGRGTYESWNATLCGKKVRFLVTFWPANQGGMMFTIGHPYPEDAP